MSMSNKDQPLLEIISPESAAGDGLLQGGRIIFKQSPFSLMLLQIQRYNIVLIMSCLVLLAVL